MKGNSLYKLGGFASILVGISYVVIGITGVLIPTKLGGVPDVQSPFMYWDENKSMLLLQWWAMLIGAVFALAMILAVSATVQHLNEGWVRWTSTLAMIAFAIVILSRCSEFLLHLIGFGLSLSSKETKPDGSFQIDIPCLCTAP